MPRIIKHRSPIAFICDGEINKGEGCLNSASFCSDYMTWREAYDQVRHNGWVCHPSESGIEGEFAYACPDCYLAFCEEYRITPYERFEAQVHPVIVNSSRKLFEKHVGVPKEQSKVRPTTQRRVRNGHFSDDYVARGALDDYDGFGTVDHAGRAGRADRADRADRNGSRF